jgi:isocitrate/isopropylmalate dehydrogenase
MKKILIIPGSAVGIGPEVILPVKTILNSLGSYECIAYEDISKIANFTRATEEMRKYYEKHLGKEPDFSKYKPVNYYLMDGLIKRYLFSKDPMEKSEYDECKYRGISQELKDAVKESAACLFGSIDDPDGMYLLFWFRMGLELFANVRPAKAFTNIPSLNKKIDLVIIRENTEGLYSGMEYSKSDAVLAVRLLTKKGVERIIHFAFNYTATRKAKGSKGELICVDKSNALPITDGYFRSQFRSIAKQYPTINTREWYVDRTALELIRAPETIDVIVTTNLYGDILSDESAALVGGLGMVPSCQMGLNYALFEPVSGTAPDIAGKNIANPLAALFSTVMMLEYLKEEGQAKALEAAILRFLKEGRDFTPDLKGKGTTTGVFQKIMSYL